MGSVTSWKVASDIALSQHPGYSNYCSCLRGQPFHSLPMGKNRNLSVSLAKDWARSALWCTVPSRQDGSNSSRVDNITEIFNWDFDDTCSFLRFCCSMEHYSLYPIQPHLTCPRLARSLVYLHTFKLASSWISFNIPNSLRIVAQACWTLP